MHSLLNMALANAVIAAVLALVVYGISRVYRRPALLHALWMLVLIKLITPPVISIPLDLPGWNGSAEQPPTEIVAPPRETDRTIAGTDAPKTKSVRQEDQAPPADAVAALPVQSAAAGENADPLIRDDSGADEDVKNVPRFEIAPNGEIVVESPPSTKSAPPMNDQSFPENSSPTALTTPAGAVAHVEEEDESSFSAIFFSTSTWDNCVWLLVAVWIAGTCLCLILATIRILLFRHLMQSAQPASESLQKQTNELARQMGLSRAPRVWLVPGAVSPMLWACGGTPRLLYPRELLGRTDEPTRATLLMHELAHMRRGDHWVRILELLTFAAYWWNPVVWWAKREIHKHEEECCDAWVVEHSDDGGRVYANALLDTIDFLSENRTTAAHRFCQPMASGMGNVDFVKHRLLQIFNGTAGGRLSRLGRFMVFAVAVAVLPMLPTLGEDNVEQPADVPETAVAGKTPAAESKSSKNNRKAEKPPAASRPFAGSGEPTQLETRSKMLQFDPLEVRALDVSPDGKLLATGHGRWTTPGVVRVRDLTTNKEIASFQEPNGNGIASVKFSPDGKLLATSGWSRTLRIRETKSFKLIHEIRLSSVARVVFSPDGKTLVGATKDEKLLFWNPITGKQLPGLEGDQVQAQGVAFSPDGRYLAVGGGKFKRPASGRLAVWDVKNRKQIKVLDFPAPIVSVAMSPDSKTLAAAGFDGQIRTWNLPDMKSRLTIRAHTGQSWCLTFAPDGKSIVSTGKDTTIRAWDSTSGESLSSVNAHPGGTYAVVFAKGAKKNKTLYSGGDDKTVRVWDAASFRQTAVLQPGAVGAEVPEAVLAVAYSPNGKYVASSHEDKTVRLRNAESGEVVKTLRGHSDVVGHLAFSPDGMLLATGGYDKTVKLWNVAEGTEAAMLTGHTNWVFAVAFSPDGKTLASGGYDKTIRLWNVANGKPIGKPLTGHTATVRAIDFSPDGKRLLSGSGDRTLKVWDLKTRKVQLTLKGHTGSIRAAKYSPDGSVIASASEDRSVKLWNAKTGAENRTLSGHTGMVWCLAFTPKGTSLASGGFDNMIMIWNTENGSRRATLRGHTDVVTSLAFAPNMRGLVSGSFDKSVRFWKAKPAPARELLTIAVSPVAVRSVAYSPNGRYMAAAGNDKLVKIWDMKNGRLRRVLRGHSGGIRDAAFSRDSRRLVTGGWDHEIHVWNVASGMHVAKLDGTADKHSIWKVDFSRDGTKIVSGGNDRTLRVWDIASRKILWKSPQQALPVSSLDVSPDGRTIVTGTGDYKRNRVTGEVKVWDLESGRELHRLTGLSGGIRVVKYSPDGSRIAATSSSGDTPFRMWNVKTNRRIASKLVPVRKARFIFLPDGRTLAVTNGGEIMLYDLETQREVTSFEGHPTGQIRDLCVSPDGSVIASAGQDGTLKLWPTRAPQTLNSRLTITAHNNSRVNFAFLTTDGKRIVTGAADRLVKVWDRATGRLLKTLNDHQSPILNGAMSPDGKLLATASGTEKVVRFFDMSTLKQTGPVLRHEAPVLAVSFTPDGKQVVSGGRGKRIRIWDVKSGKQLHTSDPQKHAVTDIAVSSDGKFIATGTGNPQRQAEPGEAKLWDLKTGREIANLPGHPHRVKSVRFSPDGKVLVTGCVRGTMQAWNVKTHRRIDALTLRGYRSTFIGNRFLLSGLSPDGLVLWDMATGKKLSTRNEHPQFVTSMVVGPAGRELVTGGSRGQVKVWPVPVDQTSAGDVMRWTGPRTIPQLRSIAERYVPVDGAEMTFSAIAANNRFLAVGHDNGAVAVYRIRNFTLARTLKGHRGKALGGAISPDANTVATVGEDRTLRLWDMETGDSKVLKGHESPVNAVAFSPDGSHVFSADAKGYIKIWNTESARLVGTFRNTQAKLRVLAVSPDGELLAAGGDSKEIELWRIRDQKLIGRLTGHESSLTALAFSPDGKTLVSGDAGRDKTKVVRIWDVNSRTQRAAVSQKTSHVLAIAFSPDGRTFVTSGVDTKLRFWDRATGQLLHAIDSGHEQSVSSINWPTIQIQLITTGTRGVAKKWSVSNGDKLWMAGFTTVSP